MRIVTDTNVVVSALLWGGKPEQILIAAREQRITLHTSPALVAELEDVMARQKFAEQLARVGSSAGQLVGDYLALAHIVKPASVARVVARDPDDDQVLACALTARAEAIITRDDDLLSLGSYQGIVIITAAQMLERIQAPR